MRIQSHCDVLNKRDLSSSSSFTPLLNGITTNNLQTTSTASTPIVTPDVSTVTGTQILIDGSTVIYTQNLTTSVTPSATSPTTASAGGATATSNSTSAAASSTHASSGLSQSAGGATATSTSTSAAASSIHASGGLSQSAKIGIGLGIPLGVIVLALLGSALYWFDKKRGKSLGDNNGLNKSDAEKKDPIDAGAINHTLEGGELHGEHIVQHPKELPGSPGSVRRELP